MPFSSVWLKFPTPNTLCSWHTDPHRIKNTQTRNSELNITSKAKINCACLFLRSCSRFQSNPRQMALNSSRLPNSRCFFLFDLFDSNASKSSYVYYQVTLTSCVVTSLLAPMAVVGNAFILAAIWKNPSLRTPSYVLLAGLAFTDFCTGLLSQPFFAMYLLAILAGNRKMICMHCWSYRTKRWILLFLSNRRCHDNNSCRKMVAYEPKVPSYCASGRYYLYHVCCFAYCVFRLSDTQLILYEKILWCIYCHFNDRGST